MLTNGYDILIQGGPVALTLQKQESIVLLSTKMEYASQIIAAITII